ncbi:MAG: hypothetical protein FWE35_28680 [Streptosporangiales bacterium]|nr:hypothetical protein [Streptosporangiales bacterium]
MNASLPAGSRDLDADDWEDQDLLTKDEAAVRLSNAAQAVRDDLAEAEATEPERVPGLEQRLRQIEAVLAHVGGSPRPVTGR